MSKNRRRTEPVPPSDKGTSGADNAARQDSDRPTGTSERDFSWYSGKVDETVVREIVRLKRAQKL